MNAWYICLNILSQNSKFNFLKRHIFKIQSDACVKFQNTHSLIANIYYVSWMRDYACQHSLSKGKTQRLSPWKMSQSNPCLAALEAHSHWNCMLLRHNTVYTHPTSGMSYREPTQEKTHIRRKSTFPEFQRAKSVIWENI